MKYIVYVIVSSENYRYTGQTDNLSKRLKQHNSGISKWTKRGTNWIVVYKEELESRASARKREKYLKSGVGREYLDKLKINN